jgi:hypothetical protein
VASHAEGSSTQATGDYSHSGGQFTLASGYASCAQGLECESHGSVSHTSGQGNVAHYGQTVIGINAINDGINDVIPTPGQKVSKIGWGDPTLPSTKDISWIRDDGTIGTAAHTTGVATAFLGANCPATTATQPFTWLKFELDTGDIVYVPAWK